MPVHQVFEAGSSLVGRGHGCGRDGTGTYGQKADVAANSAALAALPASYSSKLAGRRFDIRDYGAKVDGIRVLDAVTTAGSPTVSSASRAFVAGDVGKTIGVAMPITGTRDVWISTIVSVSVSGGVATLATNAPSSVTAAECSFGTPDDAAVAAAELACPTAFVVGGHVYLPPGRTIVTASQVTHDYVSWRGEHREVSILTVIKDGLSWMTPPNEYPDAPLTGATFDAFKIKGRLHTNSGYSSSVKPFNIYNARRCTATNLWLENTPATSIPFDEATDSCLIAFNLVTNPGRMNDGSNPGGSGIGLGTAGVSNSEPTLVIGNTILSTTGRGVNGIFTENQSGSGTDATASRGYRIVNNYVRGMRYGITDAGSAGSIIEGNYVEASSIGGIVINGGSFYKGRPGNETLIQGNTITGGTGTTDGHGILLDISYTGHVNQVGIRALIQGNQIFANAGHGIAIKLASTDVTSLAIRENHIRGKGLSGIAAKYPAGSGTAGLRAVKILGNQVVANGQRQSGSDRCGLRLEVPLLDCTIDGNDCYDDQATKTQTYGVWLHTGVTFAGGEFTRNRLRGNLSGPVNVVTAPGWANPAVVEGNVGFGYSAPYGASVGASPWTYTAAAGSEDVYIDGGTVSSIVKGGRTLRTSTGAVVRLRAGEALTITYSAVPTVTVDPTTVPVATSAPGTPTITATSGAGKVNIAGSASGASSFKVYRGTAAGFTPGTALATAVSLPYDDTTGTTGTTGTTYYYKVVATNSVGDSAISNEVSAAPGAAGTGPILYDTFTGTDGSQVGGRSASEGSTTGTWTVDNGTFTISANAARVASNTGSGSRYAWLDTGRTGAVRVKGTVGVLNASAANRRTGVIAAYVNSANLVRAVAHTAGQWLMPKIVAGTATTLVTSTVTAAAGDVVELVRAANGTTRTLVVNGTTVGSAEVTEAALSGASMAGIFGQFSTGSGGSSVDPTSSWTDLAVLAS